VQAKRRSASRTARKEEKLRLRGARACVQGSRNNKILELARSLARPSSSSSSSRAPQIKCPFFQMSKDRDFKCRNFAQDQYLEPSLSLANLDLQGQKCQLSNTQLFSLAQLVYVKKGSTVLEDTKTTTIDVYKKDWQA